MYFLSARNASTCNLTWYQPLTTPDTEELRQREGVSGAVVLMSQQGAF